MKTTLLFLSVFLSANLFGQNVNIPDVIFKNYLVNNTAVNTNGDSEIQVGEASAFSGAIFCSSLNISDLTGIEAFTSLTELDCFFNELTSLDVSSNTALISLNCAGNNLTSLDVSSNTALIELYCYWNELTSLDVSTNTDLAELLCHTNLLQCLNINNSNNFNLTSFYAHNNPNLTCIEVDNVSYSTNTWPYIDSFAYYSLNCNNACSNTSSISELNNTPKQLINIVDVLGRETPFKPNTPLLYIYDDGTVERKMTIKP